MPTVNGQKFPYTPEGEAQATRARSQKKINNPAAGNGQPAPPVRQQAGVAPPPPAPRPAAGAGGGSPVGNGTVPLRTRNGTAGQGAAAPSIPSAPSARDGTAPSSRAGELASMRKKRVSLQRQLNELHGTGERGASARSIMGQIQKTTNQYNQAQGGAATQGRRQAPQPAAPRAGGAAPAPGRVQPTSAPQAGPQAGGEMIPSAPPTAGPSPAAGPAGVGAGPQAGPQAGPPAAGGPPQQVPGQMQPNPVRKNPKRKPANAAQVSGVTQRAMGGGH